MPDLTLAADPVIAGEYDRLCRASRFAAALCERKPELLEELVASGVTDYSFDEFSVADDQGHVIYFSEASPAEE